MFYTYYFFKLGSFSESGEWTLLSTSQPATYLAWHRNLPPDEKGCVEMEIMGRVESFGGDLEYFRHGTFQVNDCLQKKNFGCMEEKCKILQQI